MGPIDFARLNEALLDRAEYFVAQWLPGGDVVGHEYVCADLSGGAGKSCSVNLKSGMWADFAGDDKGGDLISLYAASRGLNNGQAAHELMEALGWQRAAAQAVTPSRTKPPQASAPPRDEPPDAPPDAYGAPAFAGVDPGSANMPRERRKSMWRSIIPVPPHAPTPTFRHFERRDEDRTHTWEYRFNGELYGHVVRFRTSDGGKDTLPYTWCIDESDDRRTCKWHWKTWDEPRPLYVPATILSHDASLPVVLVEGEKCAEAGMRLLGHEFDFVSWPGGGKAWARAQWAWLAGRTVYMWPDCDAKRNPLTREEREQGVDPDTKPIKPEHRQPGMQTMVHIGSLLMAEHRCTVLLCHIPKPGDVSDGWDIADAIAQGWDAEQVRGFIRGAHAFVPPDEGARAKAAGELSTPSLAGADPDAVRNAWRSYLLETEKGATKAVRENVSLALDGLPHQGVLGIVDAADVIAYNEFTHDVVKLREAPWGTQAGEWLEVDELMIGDWMSRQHWLPSFSRQALEEGVKVVAHRHRFHPVRGWLERLVWDGTPRLHEWLRRVCLEEDEVDERDPLHEYLARAGTWFLQAMCARVMQPGCKFDYMLILEGPQGIGKSTVFRTLAGEYFADTGLVLGDKDSYQQLQGRWLYELGELDAFSKADINKIKLYVASADDYFRASYDRRARKYPRQVVFGGTTNEDHYLVDPTGNRRFWPIRVTRVCDIAWLLEHREQLFAEGMARWREGKRMHPTQKEELAWFAPQQQQREVENAIAVAVARYLYTETSGHSSDGTLVNEITLVELLGKIGIGVEKLGPGRYHEKQAGAALRRLGWTEKRSTRPGRPRVFARPYEPADAAASSSTRHDAGAQPARAPSDCPF